MDGFKSRNVAIICTAVVIIVALVLTAMTLSGMRTARIERQCMSQGGHWVKVPNASFISCEDATPTVSDHL